MSDPTGWLPTAGEFPYAPANGTAMSAFVGNAIDIRWDDPSTLNTGPATPSSRASVAITVVGVPTPKAQATATITIEGAPLPIGSNVTIEGIAFYSVVGAPGTNQFDASSANPSVVAANLAASINASVLYLDGVLEASSAGNAVTLTASVGGVIGNELTLGSASPLLVISGGLFTGGVDGSALTLGVMKLYAASIRTPGGEDYAVGPSPLDTAQSIAAAVNDRTNPYGFLTASASGNTVILYASQDGYLGNDIGVSSDSLSITVSAPKTSGGEGVPCEGKSNSRWTIVGVNIYRSDTGERGPYFRLNRVPVGSPFYRDRTDIILVEGEVVDWNWGWIYKGNAPSLDLWRLRTRYRPLVKKVGEGVSANSPEDVRVIIDGRVAPVSRVYAETGQIDLAVEPVWDPATEAWVYPPLPKEDGTSSVLVSYQYSRQKLVTELDARSKICYRVTTVAVDPTGTSPSGLVETPLGYSPPIFPLDNEVQDYIWKEAIKRNRWILEQGGERVKLFVRRVTGITCPCQWDPTEFSFAKQPYNFCSCCYGTGFVGGYEGPIDLIVAPEEAERRVSQTPNGRRLESTYEVWTGPRPMISQRDFIVKQNGERYSIGPVRRTQVRGVNLQQAFTIGYLDEKDIRYCVPLTGLEELPWPETRYTNPELSSCVESDPFPVGYDYQATQMGTEVPKIPDGREQRGRTPVWANITYGGKGR